MPKKATLNSQTSMFKVTLTGNAEISADVHVISFRRPFDFIAGQVIKISTDLSIPPRIYSICSGITEKDTSVLFNLKDDGILTPKLAGLIPGDTIYISNPYGSFLGNSEKAWWIATGTGIAPFYSMIKSGLSGNKTLVHGVRRLTQFYFEDELEEILGEKYTRCCSGESACNVFPGRVTEFLKTEKILPDVKYFICGQALMVVEVRDLLIERGIPFKNIQAEIYF